MSSASFEKQTAQYRLTYEKELGLINYRWKNVQLTNDMFKACVSFFAQTVIECQAKKLVVNASDLRFTLNEELQEWHDKAILPQYKKANVKAIAFITPAHIFTEVTHKKTFDRQEAKDTLASNFFNDEQKAFAWLSTL